MTRILTIMVIAGTFWIILGVGIGLAYVAASTVIGFLT